MAGVWQMRWLVVLMLIAMGSFGYLSQVKSQAAPMNTVDAFIGPNAAVIPSDALRLRIIANSNSPADQNVKQQIRDEIISLIGARMAHVTSRAEAKQILIQAVPAVEALATAKLRSEGFPYTAQTAVTPTVFPAKLYGNRVYPAGTYMALRVILGRGAGQNWWCVLFPPLCFVALADGDAVAATQSFPDYPPLAVTHILQPNGKTTTVALRLAIVDYGELWLKEGLATLQRIFSASV